MKRNTLFIGGFFAMVMLFACSGRRPDGAQNMRLAYLCETNLIEVWWDLYKAKAESPVWPATLNSLAGVIEDPSTLVCPQSLHTIGQITNVEEWTDFIYVGCVSDTQDLTTAMLISPPENHDGKFGIVVWRGGNAAYLPSEQVRKLIREPWGFNKSPPDQLEALKREISVHVPNRWKKLYSDAFRANSPACEPRG